MKQRTVIFIACALVAGCAEYSGESVAPPETSSAPPQAAAHQAAPDETPDPEVPPVDAQPPVAAPPPAPDQLFVAVEGRCRYLGVSILDGKPLVYYANQAIAEFDGQGAPTGVTIATTLPKDPEAFVAWERHIPQIERLGGRPDQLFAEVMEYSREGIRGVYRRTANGWVPARPFGEAPVDRMWPWYDGSLLAFSRYGVDNGPRFGVVRGKPKGPRFDAAVAKTGCKDLSVEQVLVLERGDVVAMWTCQKPGMFVTHWSDGDLAGDTHAFGVDPADVYRDQIGSEMITSDGADGFYIATNALEGADRLWHGGHAKWEALELPAKTGITSIATDPKGQLWIAGDKIARRAGAQWIEIENPAGRKIVELAGVEHGTPWVRTRDRVWRIENDVATQIAVPPSAFFEDETLEIDGMHFAGPDDMWAETSFVVQRRGKGAPGRYYHALLHSQPPKHPLRCGEMTDGGEMKQSYVPWPTAAGGSCGSRMVLLLRRTKWDDDNNYDKVRKAVKKIEGIETVRFAEIELGAEKFLAAIAVDPALIAALSKKTKKLRPFAFPEVVCGDQGVLDSAGVVVHRELDLAPAPSSTAP